MGLRESNEELKNLLNVVGAREGLAEVRKSWNGGKIDRKPEYISNLTVLSLFPPSEFKLPGMGLALRLRFRDVEEAIVDRYDGSKAEGSYLLEHELLLLAAVGFNRGDLPFIATLAGLQRSENQLGKRYSSGHRGPYADLKRDYHFCLSQGQPERIFPDDSDRSKNILGTQLLARCAIVGDPSELVSQAKQRIITDRHLPWLVRATVSPDWHQRLLALALDPFF